MDIQNEQWRVDLREAARIMRERGLLIGAFNDGRPNGRICSATAVALATGNAEVEAKLLVAGNFSPTPESDRFENVVLKVNDYLGGDTFPCFWNNHVPEDTEAAARFYEEVANS